MKKADTKAATDGKKTAAKPTPSRGAGARAHARKLRKSGRIASLSADIIDSAGQLQQLSATVTEHAEGTKDTLEALSGETLEMINRGDDLAESVDQSADAVADLSIECESVSKAFGKAARAFIEALSSIQNAESRGAAIHSETVDLQKSIAGCDDILKRMERTAERIDIAGINSALEAGRIKDSGDSLAIVSDGVQKASADFSGITDTFAKLVADIHDQLQTVIVKRDDTAERLRTVSVLSKSIGNTLDDIAAFIDDVLGKLESLSLITDESISLCDGIEAPLLSINASAESVYDYAEEAIESLTASAQPGEDIMSQVKRLTASVEKLSGAESDIPDDIISASEQVATACDAAKPLFISNIELLGCLKPEIDSIAENSAEYATIMGSLSEKTKSADSSSQQFRESIVTLNERLRDAVDVLREMLRESAALADTEANFASQVGILRETLAHCLRTSEHCAGFSTRMEFYAVTTRIESLRAGESAKGFSHFARDFDTVSAEASSSGKDLENAVRTIGGTASSLMQKIDIELRDLHNKAFGETVELFADILDTEAFAAMQDAELVTHITGSLTESLGETDSSASTLQSIVNYIAEHSTSAVTESEKLLDSIDSIVPVAEKIISEAEELYED